MVELKRPTAKPVEVSKPKEISKTPEKEKDEIVFCKDCGTPQSPSSKPYKKGLCAFCYDKRQQEKLELEKAKAQSIPEFTDGEKNDLVDAVDRWLSSYRSHIKKDSNHKMARQFSRMEELKKKLEMKK